MIKTGYRAPDVLSGYDEPCAFVYADGDIALDFVNHKRRDFASEKYDFELEWPFVDGYAPTRQDWEKAGFAVLSE